ncbi:hypothetical protein [Planktotalea sp.]|uniref:hypothetical protein n=1 Tax=Planktotalea sp. TaxID=2029877 RepID=UPI003D6C650B
MKIIESYQITEANIVSTNVPDDTRWDNTTNFAKGATALHIVDNEDLLWEAQQVNVNSTPSHESTVWANLGPAKKLCPFDLQVGLEKYRVIETSASLADSVTFTLTGLKRVSGIYLDGLSGKSVTVHATVGGKTVADIDEPLPDITAYNGSFWRWRFMPRRLAAEFQKTNLNIPADATIVITVVNPGGTAKLASCVLGMVHSYPGTRPGVSRSIKGRSTKKSDGLRNSLKRRLPSRKINFPVIITNGRAEALLTLLEDLDGMMAVYIGSDSVGRLLTAFGFHTSVTMTAQSKNNSEFLIEVESS